VEFRGDDLRQLPYNVSLRPWFNAGNELLDGLICNFRSLPGAARRYAFVGDAEIEKMPGELWGVIAVTICMCAMRKATGLG